MDTRKTISDEIKALSEAVAAIGHMVPFTPPPAGYFDNLAPEALLRIRAAQEITGEDIVSPLLEAAKKMPFSIPEGYFDNLSRNMLLLVKTQHTDAAAELEIISPLLGKIGKQTPFSLPEGYFENLPSGLVTKQAELADDNASEILSRLSKRPLYEVPENYFSDLPSVMLNKVSAKPARIVSMGGVSKLMRYAAAAVIVGTLLIGGLLYLNNNNNGSEGLAVNTVSSSSNAATDINNLSDSDMVNYLESQGGAPLQDDAFAAVADMNSDDDVLDLLSDVPDETLQQYLALYNDDVKVNIIN